MRWEMLTDAEATSNPGTASVVCRDMVRKENGRWKLIENSLCTTKETIITSVTSHAIHLTIDDANGPISK